MQATFKDTIMQTLTHLEAIQTHIEASAPISLRSVMFWATSQGFGGSKAIQAIQTLKSDNVINTSTDDDNNTIIDLI